MFDVIGTLVNHEDGLRDTITSITVRDSDDVSDAVARWRRHVAAEHRRVVAGDRPYATAEVLDREAAQLVADPTFGADAALLDHVATITQRLDPWPDTADLLEYLGGRYELIGLSNADSRALLRLNTHAGLRWHAALSGELVGSYKPDTTVYRSAIELAARPPGRMMMIAAHAWDLRAAAAVGMRTAHLSRPGCDPPTEADAFDHCAETAEELMALLGDGGGRR